MDAASNMEISTYIHIEEALSLLDCEKHSSLRNFLAITDASKSILRWVFEPQNSLRWAQKYAALNKVTHCLSVYRCATFASDQTVESKTIMYELEGIRNMILTKGPKVVDYDTLQEEFESLTSPSCPSESHVKAACMNLLQVLEEKIYIASQTDKSLNEHFQQDSSPLAPKVSFITFEPYKNIERLFLMKRSWHTNYIHRSLPRELHYVYHTSYAGTTVLINTLPKIQKYVEEAKMHSNDHENKLYDENYFTNGKLPEMLKFITTYILLSEEVFNMKRMKRTKKELVKKFCKNMDFFSYMLYSLPKIAVAADDIEGYIEDIITVADLLLEKKAHNPQLISKLLELRMVACELVSICARLPSSTLNSVKSVSPLSTLFHLYAFSKAVIRADVMTSGMSSSFWEPKFKDNKNKEIILSKSPDNICCICLETFTDIFSSGGDLAVLPRCCHLICLDCSEKLVATSERM